jgi:hypothetical protein
VQTGEEQATLNGHTAAVISVAYCPDGKTLASGSGDRTIKLWDVQTGKEQATHPQRTHELGVVGGVQSGFFGTPLTQIDSTSGLIVLLGGSKPCPCHWHPRRVHRAIRARAARHAAQDNKRASGTKLAAGQRVFDASTLSVHGPLDGRKNERDCQRGGAHHAAYLTTEGHTALAHPAIF